MTLITFISFFNIFVGVMLALSVLLMIGGWAFWYIRLGSTPHFRKRPIGLMQWAVSILFVLIILLAILRFALYFTGSFMTTIGVIAILVIGYFIYDSLVSAPKKEEKKEAH